MKNILIVTAIIALFVGCNTEKGQVNETDVKKVDISTIEASASELEDQTVQITGMVLHVCKHGGQKMFIKNDSTDASLLVRVGPSIPEFDVTLEGSNVEVTGKLVVSVVSNTEEAHDDEDHTTVASSEPADCPTEEALKAAGEGEECTTTITYHIEASSFKEII